MHYQRESVFATLGSHILVAQNMRAKKEEIELGKIYTTVGWYNNLIISSALWVTDRVNV